MGLNEYFLSDVFDVTGRASDSAHMANDPRDVLVIDIAKRLPIAGNGTLYDFRGCNNGRHGGVTGGLVVV